MPAPVHRLTKDEIIWLATHRCRHGHTYLDHYSCYLKEHPNAEKIGFIDIETSNLDADFGIMLCYCIKVYGKDKIYWAAISKRDITSGILDKRVVEKCIRDMQRFDRLIGFYSSRFDIPFIRTRAVFHGLEFPLYGTIKHNDVYFIIKRRFKIHRNRLEDACKTLLGRTEKTRIEPIKWIRALQGDAASIAWIVDHCKRDVRDLERLYIKVADFAQKQNRSI